MECRNIYLCALVFCTFFLLACSGEYTYEQSETLLEPSSDAVEFGWNSPVFFSEVDPVNLVYPDHEGGDAGWVELYNPADTAVNLQGLALSDSRGEPRKWVFGDVTVLPQSFVLVFLSGKNLPSFEAPHDSIDMIGSGCWTWTDAQNDPVAGYSYANPLYGNTRNCFDVDGTRHIGAVMKFGENEELGWSSISVFVGTNGGGKMDVVDLGSANEMLLTGFISKDRVLSLRLTQSDLDDWKGYEITLTGTGDSSTTYRVTLPTGKNFPDLKNIYGTRLSPEANEIQEMTIDISSYIVRNRGHEPHTNFKIGRKSGSFYLTDAQNQILDSVAYPELPRGKSWSVGVSAEGKRYWGYGIPTPYGFTSSEFYSEASPDVAGELPPSGFYKNAFQVTFDSTKQVRCELGGKLPTITSPLTVSMSVSATTVVRCASFMPNANPGKVETRTYVFENQPTVASVFIVGDPNSFFDPDTGIYMEGPNAQAKDPHYGANYWLDKELPVFVELFEPGVNSPAFSENVGYQIFGNYSRMQPKKSAAIVFREKYGKKRLNYPLFPEFPSLTKFKNFVLRNNGSNYSADYIHDRLASSISEGLGVDYQRGRPSIVYYNGEYYGIHNIRERATEYYFETHYGMDAADIDLLKADNSVTNGASTDYVALMDWLEDHHLDDEENYKYLSERIDVNNFLNYVHTEIFVNNRDWPGNNLKKWRSHNPETKWKWFLYDLDFGFGNNYSEFTNNIFEFATAEDGPTWPNGPEHTLLLRRLLENEYFKESFVNRMMALLATNFESDRILSRIEKMMAEIEPEIARDQKRWKHSKQYMETTLSNIKNFAKTRQAVIVSEMTEFFGLGETIAVEIGVEGDGVVSVNGLPLNQASLKLNLFKDVPVTIEAEESAGNVFVRWNDGEKSKKRVVLPEKGLSLVAVYK